jgi:tripartite-type tricarboxylate transporter receptor subunit TctC
MSSQPVRSKWAISGGQEYIQVMMTAKDLPTVEFADYTRSDVLPDIPTLAEFVPGYEASQWYGIGAPKDTPAEVIDKLNDEINAIAADPLIKARLAGLGVNPMSMTSAAFGKFIADETEKWGNVIQALNIKAE